MKKSKRLFAAALIVSIFLGAFGPARFMTIAVYADGETADESPAVEAPASVKLPVAVEETSDIQKAAAAETQFVGDVAGKTLAEEETPVDEAAANVRERDEKESFAVAEIPGGAEASTADETPCRDSEERQTETACAGSAGESASCEKNGEEKEYRERELRAELLTGELELKLYGRMPADGKLEIRERAHALLAEDEMMLYCGELSITDAEGAPAVFDAMLRAELSGELVRRVIASGRELCVTANADGSEQCLTAESEDTVSFSLTGASPLVVFVRAKGSADNNGVEESGAMREQDSEAEGKTLEEHGEVFSEDLGEEQREANGRDDAKEEQLRTEIVDNQAEEREEKSANNPAEEHEDMQIEQYDGSEEMPADEENGEILYDAEHPLPAGDEIFLTGRMPKNAIAEAIAVEAEIEGELVLAAYDINIYASAREKELGEVWQPTEDAISVSIRSEALAGLEEVKVYHFRDEESAPELIDTVAADELGEVVFEAESFSIYAFSQQSQKLVADEAASMEQRDTASGTSLDGKSFYISRHGWYMANLNTAKARTSSPSAAVMWTFAGDDENGYVIYSGSNRYIRQEGRKWVFGASQDATLFTVENENGIYAIHAGADYLGYYDRDIDHADPQLFFDDVHALGQGTDLMLIEAVDISGDYVLFTNSMALKAEDDGTVKAEPIIAVGNGATAVSGAALTVWHVEKKPGTAVVHRISTVVGGQRMYLNIGTDSNVVGLSAAPQDIYVSIREDGCARFVNAKAKAINLKNDSFFEASSVIGSSNWQHLGSDARAELPVVAPTGYSEDVAAYGAMIIVGLLLLAVRAPAPQRRRDKRETA